MNTLALSAPSPLQVHGHRGCRGLFPENTLPAFLHALHLGVDVLEMDVVISADQQVVVAHEPWLSARLGLSPTGQLIDPIQEQKLNLYELPYATIRQSTVGTLPHPGFPQQQAVATYRPLLAEVLQATDAACKSAGRPLVSYSIEVKSTPETEGQFHPSPDIFTATVLSSIPPVMLPRITLLSFDPRILQVARSLNPALKLCLLTEIPFVPARLFDTLGFVPDAFGPDYSLLTYQLLSELRHFYAGLSIVPWTVNELPDLLRLISWRVTGITTDYPNRLIPLV